MSVIYGIWDDEERCLKLADRGFYHCEHGHDFVVYSTKDEFPNMIDCPIHPHGYIARLDKTRSDEANL